MPYSTNISFNADSTSTLISNLNFVNPAGFKLLIDRKKYPNAEYAIQTAALPDMSADGAPLNLPQRNITAMPDKINYGPFDLTFLVDEELINYKEIHDWMLGLVTENDTKTERKTRDLTLQIYSSSNNVIREIQFVDAYPIVLSSLPFDTTVTDPQYLVAAVTFNYSYFKFL
jgi:hypothetical protein